jgi:hypothetical protein
MVEFILAHTERKFVCFVKEIDQEWQRVKGAKNVTMKLNCYGMLNRRSTLEKFKNRDIVIDDASLLNANERNRLFNFFNVRRKFDIRFWFITHSITKNSIEPLRLAGFQVICLMKGASLDYPCLNVLLTGIPNMSRLTYPAYKRIESLRGREVLVFDRESWEFKSIDNDGTRLLAELQNRPMNSGIPKEEFLKSDYEHSGGRANNNNSSSKKALVKNLMQRRKTREEILRQAGISNGYLRVILTDLRAEGLKVPSLKRGRPRAIKMTSGTIYISEEVIVNAG